MKIKCLLLAGLIAVAAMLSGCTASDNPGESAAQNDAGTETAQTDSPEGVMAAYREILEKAPALDGQPEELADASFDYEQNMEKFGKHYECFLLSDVDQNGIPELFAMTTVNFRWSTMSVFTYADGQTVLLKDPADAEAHDTFEQMSTANGAYETYICEENHIHSVWSGTDPTGAAVEENHACALEGTELMVVNCAAKNKEPLRFYANNAESLDDLLG